MLASAATTWNLEPLQLVPTLVVGLAATAYMGLMTAGITAAPLTYALAAWLVGTPARADLLVTSFGADTVIRFSPTRAASTRNRDRHSSAGIAMTGETGLAAIMRCRCGTLSSTMPT